VLNGWTPPPPPPRAPMVGRFCRLEPVDPARHAEALFRAFALETTGAMWTYLFYGPFPTASDLRAWMEENCLGGDPLFFTVVDASSDEPIGLTSYLRITPPHGVIEVGHLVYSPRLQRTRAATEAMFLMMERVFALGYRRYEWKCDALNAPSRAAAQRLGFSFEGIFRQAITYKGRNRDTAWYSIIDREWPELRAAFQRWLELANFDAQGRQRTSLSALTAPLLKQRG
jgi:RimJ/RimL family protein N-acetyltransferase